MNPLVDKYLTEGCGRCELGGTSECKVHRFQQELLKLREIFLSAGLTEDLKWSIPCYLYQNKNILTVAALKEYCFISFFKGSLLKDEKSLLTSPGENSRAIRLFRFTGIRDLERLESNIKSYIKEAIELEKFGAKVDFSQNKIIEIPPELQQKFDEMPALKTAFAALTPGRQRGYILYFTAAKQAKTKKARIEKSIDRILDGFGLNNQYD